MKTRLGKYESMCPYASLSGSVILFHDIVTEIHSLNRMA